MNKNATFPLHVFAQYPATPDGVLFAVLPTNVDKDLVNTLDKDYQLQVKRETRDGINGYIDQNGRFIAYCAVGSIKEFGQFMDRVGFDERSAAAMLNEQ